jgi:hypothetical protein
MSLNANALMDFATLQPLLGRSSSEQAQFEYYINFASDLIEEFCGRKFALRNEVVIMDNDTASDYVNSTFSIYYPTYELITCPEFPISAINHLYIDPNGLFPPSSEILYANQGYRANGERGEIALPNTTSATGYGVIELDYIFGYVPAMVSYTPPTPAENAWVYGGPGQGNGIGGSYGAPTFSPPPLPSTLQEAVLETCTWLAHRLQARNVGERYTNKDGLNTTFEIDLPTHVKSLLNRFKRILV